MPLMLRTLASMRWRWVASLAQVHSMIFRSARCFAARSRHARARSFDRIYRIDNHGMPQPKLLVRQRGRDLIGRDTGLGFRKAAAPHRRLDRIDRKYRYRQSAGETVGNGALAGAGQSGDHNELLRRHRLAQDLRYKGYSPGACAL